MGRILIIVSAAILLLFMFACSGEKKMDVKQINNQQTQITTEDTSKAICPGCGMEMAKKEMIQYVTNGQTLYFCSEHCKENYLATLDDKTEETEKAK
jgi:YHS domain-containing protein